jgi:hypothetical protein
MSHDFIDGHPDANTNFYNTNWVPDGGPSMSRETTAPDANNMLYATDPPNNAQSTATNTSETYNNFYDTLMWNSSPCSSTNTFWSFQGQWIGNQAPQATNEHLYPYLMTLPTNSLLP